LKIKSRGEVGGGGGFGGVPIVKKKYGGGKSAPERGEKNLSDSRKGTYYGLPFGVRP